MAELTLSISHGGTVQVVSGFERYSVDSDLYTAADDWEVGLARYIDIPRGAECTLHYGGQQVLHGIVERRQRSGSKGVTTYSIGGRDLMGLVVGWYIQTGRTIKGKRLADVAELFLRDIPIISRKPIEFGPGVTALDVPQEYVHVHPGSTVFDLLMGISVARGIHFYIRPNGTVVFDTPSGRGKSRFTIENYDGAHNALRFDHRIDDSEQYSSITVLGQRQSGAAVAASSRNTSSTVQNPDCPIQRPYVLVTQTDAQTPSKQARMILEQQRARAEQLTYTVQGHLQGSAVWEPDSLVDVADDRLGIRGQYLVYGRRLEKSKDGGTTTEVRLGKPGAVGI
jgi:prophage tail gpP-like protein